MLHRTPHRFARCALAALLSLGARALSAAEPSDPMAWHAPAALPAIASNMSDADYQARAAAILAGVDAAALTASSKPAAGLELITVFPGTQAQRLGMAVGDVVTAMGGHTLRFQQDLPAHLKPVAQALELWSASGGPKQVTLEPGRIGISYKAAWYPEIGFLHDAQGRSAAWDREMVVAALSVHRDPALTLAALARAQHAGYAGIYLLPLRACACAPLGRFAEALAAGEAGFEKLPQAEQGELGYALYAAALLQCKLPQAALALSRIPDWHRPADAVPDFPAYLAENQARLARHVVIADPMIAFGPARPAGDGRAPAGPPAAAAGAPAYSLIGMMRCIGYGHEDATGRMQSIAFGTDHLTVDPPDPAMFFLEISLPPVATIDCSVGFSLKARPGSGNGSDFCLFAGPPGLDGRRKTEDGTIPGAAVAAVWFPDGVGQVEIPGLPGASQRSAAPAARPSHTIRVALAEGVAAASFDGLPEGFVPLRDGLGRISLYLRVTGCEATITSFDVSTHDPQPPAGWKPVAPAAGSKAPDKGAADF